MGRERKQQECGVPVGPLAGGDIDVNRHQDSGLLKCPDPMAGSRQRRLKSGLQLMAGRRKDTIVSQRQEQRQRPSLRGSQERAKAFTNPLPSAPPGRMGGLLKAAAWLGLHWGVCEESSSSQLGQEDGLLRGGSPGSPDRTAAALWHVPLAAVLTLVAGLGHQDVPLRPSLLPLLGSRRAAVSWTNAGGLGPGPFQ